MTVMTMPLDCDEFAAKLADHLEGALPEAARVAMAAHASGCADCGRLLSEIESLRIDAAALPPLQPSRDLWAGIADRIDARVLPLDAPRVGRIAPRRLWRHPAVAAAALVMITAGITHVWTRVTYEAPTVVPSESRQVARATPAAADPVEAQGATAGGGARAGAGERADEAPRERAVGERATARLASGGPVATATATLVSRPGSADRIMKHEVEPVYDREIVKLRAIVRERRSQLDPRTIAVLEQSIAVIDSAIAQSRAALARDPASGFLATQLNHSLEKKVELLRTAALLPART